MKKYFFMIALGAIGMLATSSCNDDDDKKPEDIYLEAFQQKYPDVTSKVEWEKKIGYQVADFVLGKNEAEAWFDKSAKWVMTETDLKLADLPDAVKTAFEGGEYADWKLDDIDCVEREGANAIYVLEVEKGKQEYDLYFNNDGTFIKAVEDKGDTGHLPVEPL